jgi:cysteine desulfurase family protein (TIGR01976 family)
VRKQFPALRRRVAGQPAVYLDGPAGTQVPDAVIEAMSRVLGRGISNTGGDFAASIEAADLVDSARLAVADFVNAARAEEIVFGQNMTSLTFAAARAIAKTWAPGDEIVVTHLDHDANVSPWVIEAEARGVVVRYADFDPVDGCTLPVEAVADQVGERTRLVAVTLASNAVGTIVDVGAIAAAARSVGALSYVDAVHYAPHGPVDVQQIGCDFLVASAYKFFGPHTGVMYGRHAVLAELDAPRIRLSPDDPPEKWETGTQSFESLAGVSAAIDYLAGLSEGSDRRSALRATMTEIRRYERSLSDRFLDGLAGIRGVTLFGLPTPDGRTPTFSVDISGMTPGDAAARLGSRGIFVWSGHNYAVGVMDRLDRLDKGGLLRIGFTHYTLAEEVDVILEALEELAGA